MKLLRWSMLPVVVVTAALVMSLPRTGADAKIKIVSRDGGFAFESALVRIEPGQRIDFLNDTTQTHDVTCPGCPWEGDIQPGQSKLVTFSEVRSYSFGCRYHGEKGQIVVGDAPLSPEPTASPASGSMSTMPGDSMSGHTMPGMDGSMPGH